MNPSIEQHAIRVPLSDLLVDIARVDEKHDVTIQELALDSRRIRSGSLFFAMPGSAGDGRNHIQHAIRGGAAAIVYESEGWNQKFEEKIPKVGIRNLRKHIGHIADAFYDRPSSKLHVVGITGTNAKTSCAFFTAQSLEVLAAKCGVVGTLGTGFPRELRAASLTTPDPISLQKELARLAADGAQCVCLEVSSHALDQRRTDGVRFGTVVFTNLSQDHMDYHKCEEHYRASKSRLFTEQDSACAILNVDERFGRELAVRTAAKKFVTYGKSSADVQLVSAESHHRGLSLTIRIGSHAFDVQTSILGSFNAINLTAVSAILHSLNFEISQIRQALSQLTGVPGRMERVSFQAARPSVYIDYAHTPAALEAVLTSVREITRGRLWCIFGCGGDRDQEKRPIMGNIAEKLADEVVLTDDNPRGESPDGIMNEIARGMQNRPAGIHDRRAAIQFALTRSDGYDSVLIAGKGHETTQTYRNKTLAFNDKDVVLDLLESES